MSNFDFTKTLLNANKQYIDTKVSQYVDMKVSDGTTHVHSWNDLVEKPFYETEVIKEVLPKTTLEFDSQTQITDGSINFKLEIGNIYTVVWNGVTYDNLVCKDLNGLPTIGASDFDFSDCPILIASGMFDGSYMACFGTLNEDVSSHTISIFADIIEVVKIDKKYLPEHLQFGYNTSSVLFWNEEEYEFSKYDYQNFYIHPSDTNKDHDYLLEVGVSYDVLWDGVLYKDLMCVETSNIEGWRYIGASYIHGSNDIGDEYPFCLNVSNYMGSIIFDIMTKEEGQHSMAIYVNTTKITRIDPELAGSKWDNVIEKPFEYKKELLYEGYSNTGQHFIRDVDFKFIAGEKYEVVYNGVVYYCYGISSAREGNWEDLYIGNQKYNRGSVSVFAEYIESFDPFFAWTWENSRDLVINTADDSCEIAIYHIVEEDLKLKGNIEATAIILSSPNGTRFQITVGDDGVLTATEITVE